MGHTVLVVDDEKHVLAALRRILEEHYEVLTAPGAREALDHLASREVSLVVADNVMPGMTGVEFLGEVRRHYPGAVRMLLTGYSSNQAVMDAINEGQVYAYVRKPVSGDDLLVTVRNGLAYHDLAREKERYRRELEMICAQERTERISLAERAPGPATAVPDAFPEIIGQSESMAEIKALIEEIAPTRASVLLLGETGTGKELFARAIHRLSGRDPFICVNCAAIPNNLLESELFGHEKGSFTGAMAAQTGKFEAADSGTILFDEIGEMPLEMQAKLLRVLQEGEVTRVGAVRPRRVNVRVVASTNRDLAKLCDEGGFRRDLFFRLNVIRIEIPPLRERREDIVTLAHHLARHHGDVHGRAVRQIESAALDDLVRYDYPGNVRELANVVERAVLLARDGVIRRSDLAREIRASAAGPAPREYREQCQREEEVEKTYFEGILKQARGNIGEALKLTKLPRATFYRKVSRYGIDLGKFRV